MRPERRDLTPAGIARRLSHTLRERDREDALRCPVAQRREREE